MGKDRGKCGYNRSFSLDSIMGSSGREKGTPYKEIGTKLGKVFNSRLRNQGFVQWGRPKVLGQDCHMWVDLRKPSSSCILTRNSVEV